MAILNIKGFPDGLYKRLQLLSKKENRSVAQQVIVILRGAIEEHEPLSLLDLRGLGKEAWNETDATAHVRSERDSWD